MKKEEASAEGPAAEAEIEDLRVHFRVARQLAEARRARKLTQKEVAILAGIDQADVSDLERGDANPTLNKLSAVAAVLKLQVTLAPKAESTRPRNKVAASRAAARGR